MHIQPHRHQICSLKCKEITFVWWDIQIQIASTGALITSVIHPSACSKAAAPMARPSHSDQNISALKPDENMRGGGEASHLLNEAWPCMDFIAIQLQSFCLSFSQSSERKPRIIIVWESVPQHLGGMGAWMGAFASYKLVIIHQYLPKDNLSIIN